MKRVVLWLIVLAMLVAGGYFGYRWYSQRSSSGGSSYRTASVVRQDVVSTISATGTVVPEDVVDVGAQVNGQVASFGNGTDGKQVDYRSTVAAGAVMAKIDDALYAAQVASDEASLLQAQAAVKVAEAAKTQALARLDQSQRDWGRAQKLGESKALSQADYELSKSNYEQAAAAITSSDAQIGQAQAQVAIAEAALQRSRRNLLYCTIKSPVDGVIIDRRVEIGQTVVSSLNAPSLFLIAKDLSRMQVLVQVNEADIGQVKPGEAVTFTADAFPGEQFVGVVRKIRLNATMTQNVVTYTVEIATENAQLRLLPYLTANVRFIIDKRESVLAVANSALRWSPAGAPAPSVGNGAGNATAGNRASTDKPETKSDTKSDIKPDAKTDKANSAGKPRGKPEGAKSTGRVWVLREGVPTAIRVVVGLSDGNVTEITTDELNEGDEVIVGEVSAAAAAAASTNPFAPQMFRGGGGGGGGGARPAGAGGSR